MRSQWRMVHLVVAQILTGPERFFQWIDSKDKDSRCEGTRHVCPHSGRWLLRTWTEVY